MTAGVLTLLRYTVATLVGVVALAAFAAMAVQRRMINPFGRLARATRDLTDPLLKPIERRVLRGGGNPQNAAWWLLGGALVAGILLITAVEWVVGHVLVLGAAAGAGPRTVVAVLVDWAFSLLMLALMVRVIGSWVGVGPYTRWMRPFYLMTEWMLAPLRRVLPAFGPIDISPLAAWLILMLVRPLVIGLL